MRNREIQAVSDELVSFICVHEWSVSCSVDVLEFVTVNNQTVALYEAHVLESELKDSDAVIAVYNSRFTAEVNATSYFYIDPSLKTSTPQIEGLKISSLSVIFYIIWYCHMIGKFSKISIEFCSKV